MIHWNAQIYASSKRSQVPLTSSSDKLEVPDGSDRRDLCHLPELHNLEANRCNFEDVVRYGFLETFNASTY